MLRRRVSCHYTLRQPESKEEPTHHHALLENYYREAANIQLSLFYKRFLRMTPSGHFLRQLTQIGECLANQRSLITFRSVPGGLPRHRRYSDQRIKDRPCGTYTRYPAAIGSRLLPGSLGESPRDSSLVHREISLWSRSMHPMCDAKMTSTTNRPAFSAFLSASILHPTLALVISRYAIDY